MIDATLPSHDRRLRRKSRAEQKTHDRFYIAGAFWDFASRGPISVLDQRPMDFQS